MPRAATPSPSDPDVIARYGEHEPTFGGLYLEGDAVVVLFTADLDVHRERLRSLVRAPDRLRVERAERPYSAVEAAARRVSGALLSGDRPFPHVTGSGIGVVNGRFAIVVGVLDLDDARAAAIRQAVAPGEIVLEPGTFGHRC